ncbi:MAG: UDP-N-acetylglucosamine 1-carboxyvinyltransferase, partial [Victivallaceae bacterium]|nr:UDP-N-acetylglucosamine 1-carboxyvinyltransferase [Victivallaceae bacterium]
MDKLLIEGGVPVSGEVQISGNKNAVLPMIAACLLTDEEVILDNVPDIVDLRVMLEIASMLGVENSFENNRLTLRAKDIKTNALSREVCSKVRASILFAGPLAVRAGSAELWPPGGDVIGRRRLDAHFYGLRSLGLEVELDGIYKFTCKKRPKGRELFLDEASVTATEHIMTVAVLAEGETIIRNAAAEPHVVDLAELLIKMGALITGLGSNTITITGVEKLHGTEHRVVSDHTEAASFIALGAATGGSLTLRGTQPRHYWMARRVFERLGIVFRLDPDSIYLPAEQELRVKPDFGGYTPVISDGPWPQFPSDMMSCAIVAATQAEGSVMFFEKMFESRLYFVDRLISMGANAIVCDPHRVVITGRSQLRAQSLSSPDIRAGMAMIIAAACAKGQSEISNCRMISRGYENITNKLQ